MSYTKREWATGNVVGAVDLNRIKNGIADVDIDVDEIRGWGVQNTQLFSESVTTEDDDGIAWGNFVYNTPITGNTITVTFNGTDYTVNRGENKVGYYYGEASDDELSFSNYPFFIAPYSSPLGSGNSVATQNAGTYTIAVSAPSIQTSSDFAEVVNSVVTHPDVSMIPLLCVSGKTSMVDMAQAESASRLMYCKQGVHVYIIQYVDTLRNTIYFFPENSNITMQFVNGTFKVTSVQS